MSGKVCICRSVLEMLLLSRQGMVVSPFKEFDWVLLEVQDRFSLNKQPEPFSCFVFLDHQAPWLFGLEDHPCPHSHSIQFHQDPSCLHMGRCCHGKAVHDCRLLNSCSRTFGPLDFIVTAEMIRFIPHDKQDGGDCEPCLYSLFHWLPLCCKHGWLES